MALAFDNAQGTATTGTANVRTWALTATSGAVLLVWTSTGSGQGTVSAVAANGVALTQLGAVRYRTEAPRYVQIWGLTAPGSGVLSISAIVAAGEVTNFVACGATYVGHYTGTGGPFGGVVTTSASATTQASLIVSATTDNLVVCGFSYDDGSASSGNTVRINIPLFPRIIVADVAGATNATVSVTSTSTTYWGGLGVNLIVSSGAATRTASMSATDAQDTFAATAGVRITTRLSATDATDTFAATAKNRITARLSATESTTDTFSAAAKVRITTHLSATDVTDTFAASANVRVTTRLSATDAVDTFAATAQNRITLRLSATDAQDTFLANVTVIPVSGAEVVVPVDPGAGHGKKRNRNLKPPYIRASNDFWDARERYLLSLQPETTAEEALAPIEEISSEVPAIVEHELTQYDPGQLVTYSIKRTELIAALPTATTMRQLRSYGDELRKINRLILRQKLLGQLIEQAAREERRAERQRKIRRLRRTLATLELARSVLSLYKSQ